MAPPRFHTLTIADVRRETADAVSLAFTVPERLRAAYRYTPGQYLTLRATIDGEDVRRSYSICSGLDDGELRVVIKRLAGGAFSNWVDRASAAGRHVVGDDAGRTLRRADRAGIDAHAGGVCRGVRHHAGDVDPEDGAAA